MDHGCDALGLVCLTAGMARIICLDNFDLILWVFTFGVTFGFYISAWCQYFSNGLMILGKVNAVDDGIPVIWMCAFVSAVLGQDFWKTEVAIFGGKYMVCECIAISVAFGGISNCEDMQFRYTPSSHRPDITSPKKWERPHSTSFIWP